MIPLYLSKADAKTQLAEAVKIEAAAKEDLERLGYDKLALKDKEKTDQHTIRLQEIAYEAAKMRYIQATAANELARARAKQDIAEYSHYVRTTALSLEEALKIEEKDYKLDLGWFWKNWELWHEVLWFEFLKGLRADEFAAEMEKLIALARDECRTLRASARTDQKQEHDNWTYQYISAG
jgi:hypothetical protein